MSSDQARLFKAIFSHPANARDELERSLPPDVRGCLDLSRLVLAGGTAAGSGLESCSTGVLFETRSAEEREPIYVYLMLVQPEPEPPIPLVVLDALLTLWERHFTVEPDATTLPLILPLVVRAANEPYRGPVRFQDMCELSGSERAASTPHFDLLLVDLCCQSDRDVGSPTAAGLARLLLKHGSGEDFGRVFELLGAHFAAVAELDPTGEQLTHLLHYLFRVQDQVGPQAIARLLETHIGPAGREAAMTLWRQIFDQGSEQGRMDGLEAAQRAAAATVLLRQIALKFGAPRDADRARVETATTEQLQDWTARILTAQSLAEVWLADGPPAVDGGA